jgi:hypothetical protein
MATKRDDKLVGIVKDEMIDVGIAKARAIPRPMRFLMKRLSGLPQGVRLSMVADDVMMCLVSGDERKACPCVLQYVYRLGISGLWTRNANIPTKELSCEWEGLQVARALKSIYLQEHAPQGYYRMIGEIARDLNQNLWHKSLHLITDNSAPYRRV